MSWLCSCFAKTYETPEVLELDYRHSSLTEVPADVFSYERTLEHLDLGCNQISDLPPSLFHCHELRELDLCDNDLMNVPAAIGTLTKLVKLDLSRNGISDISDTIKSCKNLNYLDLSLNRLQKLPEGISQLVNLEELFLNDTYLEFLHANFGRLTKLRVLELRDNSLQTLPKSMNRLQHLQRIDIGQNDLSDLPEVIGTMTNLTELWCDNNSIHALPKFIGNLTKLNCLDASQNDIQEMSEDIGKCSQLSDLTVAFNALEALPESFCKLEQLSVLRLDNNSIQYLPEEFGHLKNLRELSLIRNLLKSLPTSVGLMRKLRTVYLDDNLLTELPKEIGSCSALTILSVSKNRLVTVPSEVGHLSNLKVLTVSGNLIVHLPVSLLNILNLGALWLSESQCKPLPPLNKEVDRSTGQHVLTCYLLPQVPVSPSAIIDYDDAEKESKPSRRSGTCIKFNTDLEVAPPETTLIKRGLLRAPTPYPKELRALAKHASSLRHKENGDVIINDEPVYEGDMNGVYDTEGDSSEVRNRNEAHVMHTIGLPPVFSSSQVEQQMQLQPLLSGSAAIDAVDSNVKSYAYIPQEPKRDNGELSARSVYTDKDIANSNNSTTTRNTSTRQTSYGALTSSSTSTVIADTTTPTTSGSFALEVKSVKEDHVPGKEPPPYHVAARRAAFFRSVPSSPVANISVGLPSPSPTTTPSVYRALPSRKDDDHVHKYNDPSSSPQLPVVNEVPFPTAVLQNHVPKSNMIDNSVSSFDNSEISPGSGMPANNLDSPTRRIMPLPTGSRIMSEKPSLDSVNNASLPLPPRRDATFTLPSSRQDPEDEGKAIQALLLAAQSEKGLTPMEQATSAITNEKTIKNGMEDTELVEKLVSNITSAYAHVASPSSLPSTPNSVNDAQAENNRVQAQSLNFDQNTKPLTPGSVSQATEVFDTSNKPIMALPQEDPPLPPTNVENSEAVLSNSMSASEVKMERNQTCTSTSTSIGATSNMLPEEFKTAGISKTNNVDSSTSGLRSSLDTYRPEIKAKPKIVSTTGGSKIPSFSSETKLPGARKSVGQAPEQSITTVNAPTISSSRIPRFGESTPPTSQHELLPEVSNHTIDSKALERTPSGSRIPKFLDKPRTRMRSPDAESEEIHETEVSPTLQDNSDSSQVSNTVNSGAVPADGNGNSRIPTAARKPWIFGTHRNARVVPIEYVKPEDLGFTVTTGSSGSGSKIANGIYIDSVKNKDATVKVGDKILQVDGIDVSRMGVEIVRKILGNCQDNIHLLVSRQY